MKFSRFLCLQFFIVTTAAFITVSRVLDAQEEKVKKCTFDFIDYEPGTELNDEEAYVFTRVEDKIIDIIYWLGAKTKRTKKLNAAVSVSAMLIFHLPNTYAYVTRETSKPGIKTFGDLMSVKVPEKIPRLYNVTEGPTVRQIPLYSELDINDSYVFDDGFSVTIHHSPTCEMNRKIADSLATYIIKTENGGNYNFYNTFLPEQDPVTAFEKLMNKISSTVNVYPESKTDDPPKDEVGSSKPVNKKKKKQQKKSKIQEDEDFCVKKEDILVHLIAFQLQNRPDSTTTSSNSAVNIRAKSKKKSKAAKGKTSLKENVNSSSLENEFTNAVTISGNTDSEHNKYKNIDPIFMGSTECVPTPEPLPIDTFKEKCIYTLNDNENYEILIYIGRDVDILRKNAALAKAEIDIDENSLWKVTIVLQGNPVPAHFMIHVKSLTLKYLSL